MTWLNYKELPASIRIKVLEYYEGNPTCVTENDVSERWNNLTEDEQMELIPLLEQ